MGTWQIVGKSWHLARKSKHVLGFVALIQLVLSLLALPFIGREIQPATAAQTTAIMGVVLAQFFLLPLIQGGCLSFANHTLMQPPAPFASFTQGAKKLYWRLLGFEALTVLAVLAVMLIAALLFGVATAQSDKAQALAVALSLIAAIPVGIGLYLLFLVLCMAPASMAVEGKGLLQGIGKGLKVGRAAVDKLLLISLALGLTLIPIFLIPMIPGFLRSRVGEPMGMPELVVAVVLQSAAGAISMLLFVLAYVQLYRHRAGVAHS